MEVAQIASGHANADLPAGRKHRRLAANPLIAGIGWTILGAAAARGAVLLASLLVARSLGAVSFGQLGAVENTIGMLAVLANLGLSLTSTKFVAKYRAVDPLRAGRVLGLCIAFSLSLALAVSAIVVVAAPWLANFALAAPPLIGPLRLATAVLVLSSLNGALSGALFGFQSFKALAKLNLVVGIVTVPALTFGAVSGGVMGVVSGLIAVQATSTGLQWMALRRAVASAGIIISCRDCWQERSVLAAFSLPAVLNSSLRSPVHWLCIAMLVSQSEGYTEMGLLHAANPWFLLLMFLPGQLANVYYPMFESAVAGGNQAEVRQWVWRLMRLNGAVCTTAAISLVVMAESVARLYGPEYVASAWVLRVSAATGLIIALQQPLSAYLVAVANMWLVTACSAVWAIACIASSYGLLSFGALGIAVGRLTAYAAYAAMVIALAIPKLRAGAGADGADETLVSVITGRQAA